MTLPIPDPEVSATPVQEHSGSAKRLIKKIDHSRWTIEMATYSRGPVVTSRGWNGRIAGCVTVLMSDDSGAGVLAIFLDDKFSQGFTWVWCGDCSGGFRHPLSVPSPIGYRDLCRLVSEVNG